MTLQNWPERIVRIYAVAVATIMVLSIPLLFLHFMSNSIMRSYGLVFAYAGNILVIASIILAVTGSTMCMGWFKYEREPPRLLVRATVAAILLVLAHFVLVPAIQVV